MRVISAIAHPHAEPYPVTVIMEAPRSEPRTQLKRDARGSWLLACGSGAVNVECAAIAKMIGVGDNPPMSKAEEIEKLLKMLNAAHKRVDALEAVFVRQQAMIRGLVICMKEVSGSGPEALEKRFMHYVEEVHQELLERIEDDDPSLAVRLDIRSAAANGDGAASE
jgi:hypothetical protein